jgi:titin
MEPGIAFLGHNFEEAAKLQSAHTEVLNQMQSKQSPVEELLRQADDLIAHQKPKAEVYAAMAESLGVAWKDLNGQLDRRKTLLDQNYLFQGHLQVQYMITDAPAPRPLCLCSQDYKDKTERLDDLLRRAKTSQKHPCAIMPDLLRAKKKLLEATVFALQEGDNLLASLHLLWQQATLDSRPDFIRISVSLAIEQVSKTSISVRYSS